RQVAVLNPVIGIAIADRTQGLVVQAGLTGGLAQLFRELMQGLEMVGGGRNLCFCGLEELLLSLVDQPRDLAADQDAGLGKETHSAIIGFLNGRGAVELLQENTVLRSRGFQDVKSVVTKPVHSFFIRGLLSFLCHRSPDAVSIPRTNVLLSP